MQGEFKSKSICTILITFHETNFVDNVYSIREESDKTIENPLPKWVALSYCRVDFKNSQLVERYDQVFEDEILKIRVMVVFQNWPNWLNDPRIFGLYIILIQWILCLMIS